MTNHNLIYPFSFILFLFVMFPYVSPVETPFDTQPYALGFSIVLLLLMFFMNRDIKVPKVLMIFLFIAICATVRALFSLDLVSIIRSLVGYYSIFFLALVGYYTFKYVKGKYFTTFIFIWFIFGLLQTFVYKLFGSFMVARMSTSEGRGVTSLAVEPSFYAILCVFFLIMNDVMKVHNNYTSKTHKLMFLLLSVQIVFSQSALGFVIFAVYMVSEFLFGSNFLKKLIGFVAVLSSFSLFYILFTKIPSLIMTRVGHLVYLASHNPMNLIFMDGSISDRLSHILVSFSSLFHSYGFGFGIANFDEHAVDIANNSGDFVYQVTQVHLTLGRIMSAWGTAVFELGVIGLLMPLTFFYIMRKLIKSTKNNKKTYKVALMTIFATMMTSVPLALPIFGYLIGIFVYLYGYEGRQALKSDSPVW